MWSLVNSLRRKMAYLHRIVGLAKGGPVSCNVAKGLCGKLCNKVVKCLRKNLSVHAIKTGGEWSLHLELEDLGSNPNPTTYCVTLRTLFDISGFILLLVK